MRYHWDYIEKDWKPNQHPDQLTRKRHRRIIRRSQLIEDLMREIDLGSNSITSLYANMLARALVQTDEKIMSEYGKRVAELSATDSKRETHDQKLNDNSGAL
jgi:hypothetical protein